MKLHKAILLLQSAELGIARRSSHEKQLGHRNEVKHGIRH